MLPLLLLLLLLLLLQIFAKPPVQVEEEEEEEEAPEPPKPRSLFSFGTKKVRCCLLCLAPRHWLSRQCSTIWPFECM
jgi:hypothetical protein